MATEIPQRSSRDGSIGYFAILLIGVSTIAVALRLSHRAGASR